MDVVAERLDIPKAYGDPSEILAWEAVERRLVTAMHYWLATTRPDGRPHSVPIDGVWDEGALWFGGVPSTVHSRNLRADPRTIAHIESAESPVIVEGSAEVYVPDDAGAERRAESMRAKYGYGPPAATYREGVWCLRPVVALSWTALHRDATRFRFH